MRRNTIATTTGVTTIGMMRIVRMKRMPAISREQNSANAKPKMVSRITAEVTKLTVTISELRNCGSLHS